MTIIKNINGNKIDSVFQYGTERYTAVTKNVCKNDVNSKNTLLKTCKMPEEAECLNIVKKQMPPAE